MPASISSSVSVSAGAGSGFVFDNITDLKAQASLTDSAVYFVLDSDGFTVLSYQYDAAGVAGESLPDIAVPGIGGNLNIRYFT